MCRSPLRIVAVAVLALFVVAGPRADVEVTLDDGQRFAGRSIDYQREEGIYVLELGSGDLLPLPAELVAKVRLTGEDAAPPGGLDVTVPRTLAGPDRVELPKRSTQLRVFEEGPARFAAGPFDPIWRPTSDWDLSPANNEFNPARWIQAPIAFEWVPRSAFTAAGDVTEFSPSRWAEPLFDVEWIPEDGFAPR